MNVPPSSKIQKVTFGAPNTSDMQGGKVGGDDNKGALEKALQDARLRRNDEEQSVESQQKKQVAALRTVRGNQQANNASLQTKAALDIARALGLDAKTSKVLLQKEAPADLGERLSTMLGEQSLSSIEQSINDPKMKSILKKATSALNSSDPFGALGVSPEAVCSLIPNAPASQSGDAKGSEFAKAIGEALGMIQKLMGKSAETAALLAKFEEAFESLKAEEAANTIKYMQSEQAHYDHEKRKMDTLGILKKIFGAIIAAILAAIAAVTGNAGLMAVAVILVVVTFVPKAMDTICEGFARDVLRLKGKAAEAVSLFMRVLIAVALTAMSGGAGGASTIGSVLSQVGTFSGSFMLAGGAENIANLAVDAEHNCDVYSGDATDAEKAEASHDAEIAGYVLLAVSFACMLGSGAASLVSDGSSAATEASEEAEAAPQQVDEPAPEEEAQETENEVEETEQEEIDEQSEAKKNEDAKEMRKRKFLKAARYGLAGATAADGSADVAMGQIMLTMAGIIGDLMKTQGALSMSQASIKIANQEMKRDEASDQATTSQGIDSIKNITIDESIAYQHQIVGATAV